ncbi:MAG TPA: ABC transporter permease subunit [Vicinamibacterales bacterium]|nr:ABC transporter permease subunit [Vicinamibacterales bacterium]
MSESSLPVAARPAVAAPPAPSLWNAVARVFDLSLGQMIWSRRTIFMAVVLGAPIVLAIVVRIVDASGVTPLRVNGQRVGGTTIFGVLLWWLYLRFVVPVLGVFYGTALIADEVEDKTITYLFTRPVARRAVLIGKYLAYVVCTSLVVLPSIMIVFFLVVPLRDIGPSFLTLLTDLGLLAFGLAVYGALFALVGTVLKRPLVVGLVFAFGWEQVAMLMPGYLRQFTIVYYLQGLVPHAIPSDGITSLLASVFNDAPSAATCLFWLAFILIAALLIAARAIERREYVLGQ